VIGVLAGFGMPFLAGCGDPNGRQEIAGTVTFKGPNIRYDDPMNRPVTTKRLAVLTCPSDTPQTDSGTGITYHNYAVNFGNTTYDQDRQGARLNPYMGVTFMGAPFSPRVAHAVKDITDGLSNTLLAAEVRQGVPNDRRGWVWFQPAGSFETFYAPNSSSGDSIYGSFCSPTPPPGLPCVAAPPGPNVDIIAARSQHPGGVNVALCDGSCRFVSNDIDINVWRNLGSSQDGLVTGDY
jgi:prepilin-type processing-associated H-X9-DG protein